MQNYHRNLLENDHVSDVTLENGMSVFLLLNCQIVGFGVNDIEYRVYAVKNQTASLRKLG
jgi:hypothetical protein